MIQSKLINRKTSLSTLLVIAAAGSATSTFAIEPSPIVAGSFDVIPTVRVEATRDSNTFRSSTNEIDTDIYIIAPKIRAELSGDTREFGVEAEIIDGSYADSSDDDFTDWIVRANASLAATVRNQFDFTFSRADLHDDRGTGYSEGGFNLSTEPDEYEQTTFGVNYQFGAPGAKGRIALSALQDNREYTNNPQLFFARDRDNLNLGATFFLNVFANADFLVEYRHLDIDYQDEPASIVTNRQDSTEKYAYVGMEWQATAKTSGSVRVGRGKKEFDAATRGSSSTPSFELGLQWAPLSYSTFALNATRRFDESYGFGDSIERQTISLDWDHNWTDRISSSVELESQENDYSGSARTDTIKGASVRVNYSFTRWMDFNLTLRKNDRDSDLNDYNYDRSLVTIGLEASL